jgi:hypothetical protein
MSKIQKGWEPMGGISGEGSLSSVRNRVSSKEILQRAVAAQASTNVLSNEPQSSTLTTIADSMPATENEQALRCEIDSAGIDCVVIGFRKIGPAAFDMWLRPELEAIGARAHLCGDDNSGEALVPHQNEEQAKEIITSWCMLVEDK